MFTNNRFNSVDIWTQCYYQDMYSLHSVFNHPKSQLESTLIDYFSPGPWRSPNLLVSPDDSEYTTIFDVGVSLPKFVENKEEFFKNFQIFTNGILEGVDWTNVFMAGGAVLGIFSYVFNKKMTACLMSPDTDCLYDFYFKKSSFASSDIDLFICNDALHVRISHKKY